MQFEWYRGVLNSFVSKQETCFETKLFIFSIISHPIVAETYFQQAIKNQQNLKTKEEDYHE